MILPSTAESPPAASLAEPSASAVRGLRILLVDDDEAVRTVVAEQLRDAGSVVEAVASGEEALAAAEGAKSPFDVVLSDYAMPGLNGIETVQALRARQPGIGAVVMTGYADEETVGALGEGVMLVRKPVPLEDLLRVLASRRPKSIAGSKESLAGTAG